MILTVLASGPLFAAPLSEEYGRNAFIVLQIGVALVHNIGGFLFLRLLSGIAVSPPATLGAGTITDVPPPQHHH
jgi:MFS family permease